jgi:predicted lysophospholipase L1 biosynthesis ABC-type transport system permease subunit
VVNEVFAKKYFAGTNPVGRTFGVGGDANKWTDIRIVGMSRAARTASLKEDIPPTVYIPYSQDLRVLNYMVFELRTVGNPLGLVSAVREVANEVSPRVPVFRITTQAEQVERTIGQEKTFAQLCACFAVLALTMASVGLYGMMGYAVSRRTNEIGIRMALGSGRGRIIGMVLGEVLTLLTAGLAIGLGVAWTAARFVESFLFGMKARDPLALLVSAAILAGSAVVAGYVPAWRASRIDPMDALRDD